MFVAMAVKRSLLLAVAVLHAATLVCFESVLAQELEPLSRNSFPDGFIFGAATAAYQVEGGANEGGRGPSIWDTFTHQHPEKITDRSNGDVAVDSYHRYKEDVQLLDDLGMDAYRFSISWSRVLPKGNLRGGINREGIKYYNNLINEVISKGMKPFVTIFHWDVPQALEDSYGGFLSPKIIEDFKDFAELCFRYFGDRVKHWITLNEPWSFTTNGYNTGVFAPGRCSSWQIGNCSAGDSATEPYIVTHNLLLSHAHAVRVYRRKYQERQKGVIGVTHLSHWFVPFSFDSARDYFSTRRSLDFMIGWYMNPVTTGDYPRTMRTDVGDRLPEFTRQEAAILKGSIDFLGLNYYTTYYSENSGAPEPERLSYSTDPRANTSGLRNGVPIGPQPTGSAWQYVYPRGFQDLLVYIAWKFNNPVIYITENGMGDLSNASLPLAEALNDTMRVDFYRAHLSSLVEAIRSGVKVRGFFAWSLLDNFEWASGYTTRFGLYFVDYANGLKRIPKQSVQWFKGFLKKP